MEPMSRVGQVLGQATSPRVATTWRGLVVLARSFLSMPLSTIRATAAELRAAAESGHISVGTTSVPHLTWLVVAGHALTSLALVAIMIGFTSLGLMSVGDITESPTSALLGLVGWPIVGVMASVVADWALSAGGELLQLLLEMHRALLERQGDRGESAVRP